MRKEYIDVLKGISIIAIMLLHFEDGIFPTAVNIWIGSFMISAFYFVSGWLTYGKKPLTDLELIKKRWKTLGIPYCSFTLICFAYYTLLYWLGLMEGKLILRDIYKTLTLRGIGTLWFLPALFFGEIIFNSFRKSSAVLKITIILATTFYLSIYSYWDQHYGHINEYYRLIDAPFRTLQNIVSAWYVIAAGYYLRIVHEKSIAPLSRIHKLLLALLLLIWYTLAVDGKIQGFGSFIPIIGPWGLLLICEIFENNWFSRFWAFWGRNSLIIMVTHYTILQGICIELHRYWTGESHLFGCTAFLYFTIAWICEYPVILLINSRARFLLGKN